LQFGENHTLKLIYSAVPDFPYATNLVLIYEWYMFSDKS
jgi:hypothetical protein